MSLKEIEEEMAALRKELRETPADEQQPLLARLANLGARHNQMRFGTRNFTTQHHDTHEDEDDQPEEQ